MPIPVIYTASVDGKMAEQDGFHGVQAEGENDSRAEKRDHYDGRQWRHQNTADRQRAEQRDVQD